ncbi:MAG: O-antigen ligase family protein, partial [Pseudomonadota bacterium]
MARKINKDKKTNNLSQVFSPPVSLPDNESFLDKIITLAPLFLLGAAPLIFFKMGGEFENNPKMLFLEWGIGLLALIQALRIQPQAFSWIRTPLDFPLVAFYCFCWVSLLQAANPWQATLNLLHWGAAIVFYFFLVHTIKKQGFIDHIFVAVAISVIPVSILGILQKLSGVTWGIPQLTVPASTFSNQNMAAQFLAITFPLCIGAVFCSKQFWMKLAGGISLPLSLLYLLYTQARGPWLAVLIALVLFLIALFKPPFASKTKLYLKQKKIIYTGIALVVIGILLLMSPARKALQLDEKIKNRFVSIVTDKLEKRGSSQLRYIWWRNTLEMVQDNFFLGVGLGNFKLQYPPYHLKVEKDWSFT